MNDNMEHISPALPDQKNYEYSYGLALKMASEKLVSFQDIGEQCRKSDSVCQINGSTGMILVIYLNRTYQITLPDVSISIPNSSEKVELRDKILLLHYITQARGTPLSNHKIAFKELKEGANYFPTYYQRAIKPLIDFFGRSPETLEEVAKEIGSYRANHGDVAVTIPAFSRVPITLVIWKGDDEFLPDANILFDSTIMDYLSAEDIIILCQTISWKLVRALQAKSNVK